MPEENVSGSEVPEGSKEAAVTKAVSDAILNVKPEEKTPESVSTTSEKPKGEIKEPEKKPEPAPEDKEKPPSEDVEERAIKELLEQFKGDPKAIAKAYANLRKLDSTKDQELGDLRTRSREQAMIIEAIDKNPKEFIAQLEKAIAEKENEVLAIETPEDLGKFVRKQIDETLMERQQREQAFARLKEKYPDFDRTLPVRENLKKAITDGSIDLADEILHLAAKGFHAQEGIKLAREEGKRDYAEELNQKMGKQVEKQAGVDVEEKPLPFDKAWAKHLLDVKRPFIDAPE